MTAPWDVMPWERALLWKVDHEVREWNEGRAHSSVAIRNIASFLAIPVRPYPPEKPRRRRR